MYSLNWHLIDIVVDDSARAEKIQVNDQDITGTDNVDQKAPNCQKTAPPPRSHVTIIDEGKHSDIMESSIVVDKNGVESLDSNSSSSSENKKNVNWMSKEGLKDSMSHNLAHSQDNEIIPGDISDCNENDQLKESNDLPLGKITSKITCHIGKYILLNILNP